MITVGISSFIKEQSKKKGGTRLIDISLEEIALYAQNQLNKKNYKQSYREGVVIIEANDKDFCKKFTCPLIKVDKNTELICKINRRSAKEEDYIQVRALNKNPLKTNKVEIILYRKDVLEETEDAISGQDWELIAFHAMPVGIQKMPMKPVTMMRNQLQLIGGTKAHYSSEEWAESIYFWQKYALLD